ncbi:MAG: polysaccharide deacetylase family protein [Casimicrobiaceae bacterium]
MPVLTYHSISASDGPTSIPPGIFRMQLEVLAERGYSGFTEDEFIAWQRGAACNGRRVLLTFDDAFADFAEIAHPLLRAHGFTALVFVPTGAVGGRESWSGANGQSRRLLDWKTIAALAGDGTSFGGHGVDHEDLTRMDEKARRGALAACATKLAEQLGVRTRSFAPPYGRANAAVRVDIGRVFDVAFGTSLDRATCRSNSLDLPRIEMHYFRNPRRWRAFLDDARSYFLMRRLLRAAREGGAGLLRWGGER